MRNPYQQHLSEMAHGADPLELVVMLYSGARSAVSAARRHLHQGDITSRSRQIGKAMEIVLELSSSLDQTKGGEIASKLSNLYAYMVERLSTANLEQVEAPLIEVESLLKTLEEAWKEIQVGSNVATASSSPVQAGAHRPYVAA